MRARPRRRDDRLPARGRGRQGAGGAAALPRPLPDAWASPTSARWRRRRCATPPTARSSSSSRSGRSAARSSCSPARARRSSPALGVVSSIHEPDGVVGDLGGGSLELTDIARRQGRARRHAAARRPVADGRFPSARRKRRRKIARDALAKVEAARQSGRPHVLRRRRHLARAGAAAYAPAPISDAT